MIKIYKASAGSGKTYQLSKTYRDLLLNTKSDNAYRNILAVTFTNKATEEMKERILNDLHDAAATDYKAQKILTNLLHDYGSFSVSTIDKFFQQALRAFSREIGYSASYQIELDKDSLIAEASARILDELTEDQKDLLDWIKEKYASSLQAGNKPDLEKSITDIGKEFCRLPEEDRSLLDKKRLARIRKKCEAITKSYLKAVSDAATAVGAVGKAQQKALDELKASATNNSLYGFSDKFTSMIRKCKTADQTKVEELCDLLEGKEHRKYVTAQTISQTIFTLGFEKEFFDKLLALEQEKNVLSLDESTTLLKKIIGESDAPFIYEKLGVRYNHFLLDEFQDTSRVQWENFLPLLRNSVAENYDNLIVGDVKQSIYRWRDSDWRLLNEEIEKEFRGSCEAYPKKENWRSNKTIVKFNNYFFIYAAKELGLDENIYSDVRQKIKVDEEDAPGRVTVTFLDKDADQDDQLKKILAIIKEVQKNGAELSDIGILTRRKNEGSRIAEFLISQGFDVISNDSLLLSSSSLVTSLISVLQCIDNPDDTLSRYLADKLHISLDRPYHSLLDLCDSILNDLRRSRPEEFTTQTLFVQSFMDYLLNWVNVNGNNLHEFLSVWSEKADKLTISSPEGTQAINIMTIHKAKGLAFPVVIFPYAEKIKNEVSRNTLWCRLSPEGLKAFGGDEDFDICFPLKCVKALSGSYFAKAYEEEARMDQIDNLNLFYVCLTRARKEMHIISAAPENGSVSKFLLKKYEKFLKQGTVKFGKPYTGFAEYREKEDQKKKSKPQRFDSTYESYTMNPEGRKKRFVSSSDAWDFFEETGVGQSRRRVGIELHALLSQIDSTDNLDYILRQENQETAEFIREKVQSRKNWFSPDLKVLNETSIIDSDGNTYRPDRVVIDGNGEVSIIDFKFGEENEHYRTQVSRYMSLFREMGYKRVRGYLWYVYPDNVEEISTLDL